MYIEFLKKNNNERKETIRVDAQFCFLSTTRTTTTKDLDVQQQLEKNKNQLLKEKQTNKQIRQ